MIGDVSDKERKMVKRRGGQSVVEYVVIFCVVFLALIFCSGKNGFIRSVRNTLDSYTDKATRAMVKISPF